MGSHSAEGPVYDEPKRVGTLPPLTLTTTTHGQKVSKNKRRRSRNK